MNFDIISFLLGCFVSALLINIIVYWRNTEYANSDVMGAMINWHTGFCVAWLPIVIAGFIGTVLPWWSGFILLVIAPVLSFVINWPINFVLQSTGMSGKAPIRSKKDPRS